MIFDETDLAEISRRNAKAEATRDARKRALGPHPVALALRDIAVGLETLHLWDAFLPPSTLHAAAGSETLWSPAGTVR